ncbi:cell division protein DamX [Enterobacter sp. Ap-916]|uniref:cell division protein DamX n=1 Tax=Enterobacteriaceae TaxID=543 RepID=UPI001420B193|nr:MULTISPECIES: cell division protein DamX [unclassified Enterobacter]NIF59674.1 cell division protein DamX [Enterobacter sp. Ap-867]NIG31354.1 cell division protein DamX [Enterobacter sp. Ap-916]
MDEFKPEDELKPDPSDRRPGRSRKPDEFDKEPQINVDDVDLDADDRRPSRSRREREEEVEEEYEGDDGLAAEPRPARGRKKAAKQKAPASRQHIMMGVGILVLLLLIIGIGSALKAPSSTPDTAEQKPGAEKSIDLSGSNGAAPADQANAAQPQAGNTSVAGQQNPQDVSLPPISSTPTQAQTQTQPEGQQRVEVPGNLNNALTQPQQQGQIDNVVSNSTLPTEPATVAPIAGSKTEPRKLAGTQEPTRTVESRPERKKTVIEPVRKAEPKPQVKAESKPVATVKRSEPAPAVSAPVTAPSTSAATSTPAPKATASTAPKAAPQAAATASTGGTVTGDASAIKSAPGSHYTLQLSSSSNSANLNAWAKKENLQHYMVYQTQRNGQPWFVLVSGVYATKDDAKRAVTSLPADVQAKNPWAKPIHQVQSDLK